MMTWTNGYPVNFFAENIESVASGNTIFELGDHDDRLGIFQTVKIFVS